MATIDFKFDPKSIDPTEQTPLVSTLLSLIEQLTLQLSQQAESLANQSKKIDELLSEIRQLKKLSKKPKLRASTLPKDKDDKDNEPPASDNNGSKRPGSSKRSKNKSLTIDREELIGVENVPMGSVRKGYQSYVVQDLIYCARAQS